jgi:hypothetical protein
VDSPELDASKRSLDKKVLAPATAIALDLRKFLREKKFFFMFDLILLRSPKFA